MSLFKTNFSLSLLLLSILSCNPNTKPSDDVFSYALSRKNDLKLSIYITAQAVDQLLSTEAGRREALSLLKANGITSVYVEVYRSGMVVPNELLKSVSTFFKTNGFEVIGGIATVPGGKFGKAQEGRLGWFNWENKKTRDDLEHLMDSIAPIFDAFIVDDFLCTADTSLESKTAKKELSWTQYRQNLLVDFSEKHLIGPAKKANPNIRMIIKYPQWYDRYHLFGYDVARQPAQYDQVAIGTETRGQYTKRFGFVQPYEGFINYRWMASLSGNKMRAAWFDHIDCNEQDFIDQAYQSVLAGAKELILFNYFNFIEGHPGQHRLRYEFHHLADLAAAVAKQPVDGPAGYKPASSEPGGDMYILDFIGMLGIPLIPYSQYPDKAESVFLPTQAAADTNILEKIKQSIDRGCRVIMTSGFLAIAKDGKQLAKMAGVAWPIDHTPLVTQSIIVNDQLTQMDSMLQLGARLKTTIAVTDLEVSVDGHRFPYLSHNPAGNIYVLNVHTFSDEDFKAVGEVLLCPNPLGILEIPRSWVNKIRTVFIEKKGVAMDGPSRITLQPFGEGEMMVQNYNQQADSIQLELKHDGVYVDIISGKKTETKGNTLNLMIAGRSRVWLKAE
ncbi:MAG: hypothetical protein SH818_09375 [Saprospiraceae bacterium]|nr:hypothetical protein [Saprospiraceae bacterium]